MQADGVKVVRVLSQPGVPPLVGVAAGHRYQRGWKQFAHSLAHRQNGRHVCGGIGPAPLVLWIMQIPVLQLISSHAIVNAMFWQGGVWEI